MSSEPQVVWMPGGVRTEAHLAGDDTLVVGQTIHIPAGVVHAGGNVGDGTGRRVVMFSPAGMERFFLETGVQAPDQGVDARAALESAMRHGWEIPSVLTG